MARQPAKTYRGRPCKHCGSVVRRVANKHCDRCYRKRRSSDEWRARNRERYLTEEFRARHRVNQRDYRRTSDVAKGNLHAGVHRRRARKRNALPSGINAAAVHCAFAKLSREARRLGMSIDHVVPLAGCRVCGKRGKHVQSNWAMLPAPLNSAKGNRCMSCWMLDTGRSGIVWLPDQVRHTADFDARNPPSR